MLVPAKRDFFNEFMMSPFDAFFDSPASNGKTATPGLMKTDIKETEANFQLTVDLPGASKENVTLELKDGYLEISASYHRESDDEEKGTYLRKERFDGKCTRSFFVGDEIVEDEISAKFDNGTLKIVVPKMTKPELQARRTIAIEG